MTTEFAITGNEFNELMEPEKPGPTVAVTSAGVATQISPEPTNKLATGTTVAAGAGAVIAGAFSGYGGDMIKEIWESFPALLPLVKTEAFVVAAISGLAVYLAGKYSGLAAGYQVLDAPNKPMLQEVSK